jgi:hypothetical protein
MQTTLRIDDQLYREAKAEAAREGITLTRFLENALRLKLHKKQRPVPGKPHPFPVYIPEKPLNLTNEEIKRIDQEEQLRHDLKKLGIEQGDA